MQLLNGPGMPARWPRPSYSGRPFISFDNGEAEEVRNISSVISGQPQNCTHLSLGGGVLAHSDSLP